MQTLENQTENKKSQPSLTLSAKSSFYLPTRRMSTNTNASTTKRTRNTTMNKQKNHKRSKATPRNKRATAAQPTKMNDQRDDKSDSDDVCLICCEPIRFYAVGPCNHRNICSLCSVRRRSLYDQYDCCLCKQDLEQVVFTLDRSQPFSAFNIGLLTTQPTLPGVYFADQVIVDEISNLFSLRCPICSDQSFTNLFALKEHVKKHQLHYW